MTTMTPRDGRTFWKALMDNASALIADAHILFSVASFGRAGSLTVLAQEELGKALWIYNVFESSWSTCANEPRELDSLAKHGRKHVRKFHEAFVYGGELAAFWGDDSQLDIPQGGESWAEVSASQRSEADDAAKGANTAKQLGFYVDRTDVGVITSPTQVQAGTIADDLQVAAQVVEMLLIRDHSRMKMEAVTEYDSTHAQQFRLLPISHPEEWAAATEDFRRQDDAQEKPGAEG